MISEIKFGLSLPTRFSNISREKEFNKIISYAIKAEMAGFDQVSIPDRIFIPYEALSLLTAIAMKTKKIKLGTQVINANRRNPAILAHVTATLDKISGGRFILGIGRGGVRGTDAKTFGDIGFPVKKLTSRMREVIIVLKKFWTEDKVNYAGSFFNYKDAVLEAKPTQKPHPPIWIAAFGPRMLKITGELANGFITQYISPELFYNEFNTVKDSARRSGRDPDKITGVYCAPMAVASEYNNALQCIENRMRDRLYRYGGHPWDWAKFFGYKKPWKNPEDIPLEIVDRCCIFGTPDDCIAKIEKFRDKGASYFIPEDLQGYKLFSEKVIAYFKDD